MDEVLGNECLSLQYCPSMGDNLNLESRAWLVLHPRGGGK